MKNKSIAAGLAFFLGGLGIHKFYLNQGGRGILYALFCWTFIPMILGFLEALSYISMSQESFDIKYNQGTATSKTTAQPSTLKDKTDGSTVAICPACAEEIKPEAVKCKHCGADITPKTTDAQSLPDKEKVPMPLKVAIAIFAFFMLYSIILGIVSVTSTG